MAVRTESFVVKFANGDGDGTFSTLRQAQRAIARRVEHDPPPPDILPAEIWRRTYVDYRVADFRLIERFPPD